MARNVLTSNLTDDKDAVLAGGLHENDCRAAGTLHRPEMINADAAVSQRLPQHAAVGVFADLQP